MRKATEIVNLRDGECIVTMEGYSVDDVRALPDAELMALTDYAMNNWKFRDAPSKSKKDGYVNNGKTFSFEAIVKDMTEASRRDSGPSKADKERAAEVLQIARIDWRKENPIDKPDSWFAPPENPDERLETTYDRALSEGLQIAIEEMAEGLRSEGGFPNLVWDWDDDQSALDNLARLAQAKRLYVRPARKGMI